MVQHVLNHRYFNRCELLPLIAKRTAWWSQVRKILRVTAWWFHIQVFSIPKLMVGATQPRLSSWKKWFEATNQLDSLADFLAAEAGQSLLRAPSGPHSCHIPPCIRALHASDLYNGPLFFQFTMLHYQRVNVHFPMVFPLKPPFSYGFPGTWSQNLILMWLNPEQLKGQHPSWVTQEQEHKLRHKDARPDPMTGCLIADHLKPGLVVWNVAYSSFRRESNHRNG